MTYRKTDTLREVILKTLSQVTQSTKVVDMFKLTEELAKHIEGSVGIVANQLAQMTDEQRTDIFSFFCTQCGAPDPECQCCNDE